LAYQRKVIEATGLPGFLTDVKPRNVGYLNGEFVVFDPALLDPFTPAILAAVLGGAAGLTVFVKELLKEDD
jgi:hypothetical protein